MGTLGGPIRIQADAAAEPKKADEAIVQAAKETKVEAEAEMADEADGEDEVESEMANGEDEVKVDMPKEVELWGSPLQKILLEKCWIRCKKDKKSDQGWGLKHHKTVEACNSACNERALYKLGPKSYRTKNGPICRGRNAKRILACFS